MFPSDHQVPAPGIAECIRTEILPCIPVHLEQFTSVQVVGLKSKIHALQYYGAANGAHPGVQEALCAALGAAQGLWELLEANASTFTYLRQMEKIRGLDITANLAGQWEEGAELPALALGGVATLLSWFSDTIWVELARQDQAAVPRAHALQLQDELWKFLGDPFVEKGKVTLSEAAALRERIDAFFKVLTNEDLPCGGRIVLLTGMYHLLLRLNLGKATKWSGESSTQHLTTCTPRSG